MQYQRYANDLDMEIGFNVACLGMSEEEAEREAKNQWYLIMLTFRTMVRKCKTEGHRLVDDSYGGPESGCIDMTCARCGWCYHARLY